MTFIKAAAVREDIGPRLAVFCRQIKIQRRIFRIG